MSSDLWAAFGSGDGAENPWTSTETHQITKNSESKTASLVPISQGQADAFDPWASFEAPKTQNVKASTSAQPIPVENEWAAFQFAAPPSDNAIEDGWSAFESSAPDTKPSQNAFNDDGLMWDADSALQAEQPASQNRPVAAPTLIDISGLGIADNQNDDDEFGDFEQAQALTPQGMPPTPPIPAKVDASSTIMQTRIETRGVHGADRRVFGTTRKVNTTSQSAAEVVSQKLPGRAGDVSSFKPAKPEPTSNLVDTSNNDEPWDDLGWTSTSTSAAKPAIKAGNTASLKPVVNKPKPAPKPAPAPALIDNADDDYDEEAWDDFTSLPPDPKPASTSKQPIRNSRALNTTTTSSSEPATSSKATPPPTNIPPPSILLSHLHLTAIPSLIASSSTTSPVPSLRTAAHILAGRKSRWKRDTHLAQSMSISASGPGLKSGMKLTGVDKTEAIREDREAAELARVFKQSAGALRSKAMKAGEKGVVDLGGNLVVKSEKAGTGIVGGMKPCVICGLRRAERVNGVDGEVYDGFGEWWVEHWGHKDCKEWWEGNEGQLGKR